MMNSTTGHGCMSSRREKRKEVGPTGSGDASRQISTVQDLRHLSRDTRGPRVVARSCSRPAMRPDAGATEETPIDIVSQNTVQVPLVGRIAAGRPILAEESIEGTFSLPRQLVGGGALFMLKVAGDSMINAAIADGDWVVVRQQSVADNGEIVAAMVDGEATIKTFERSNNHVWLMPHNPAYAPILGDEATILGKVVALLRRI